MQQELLRKRNDLNASEQSRVIVIQFLEYLFHYCFTEEDGFCAHTEFITIQPYRCHLAVIKIDDLTMAAYQSLLLFLEIFRIDAGCALVSSCRHDKTDKFLAKLVN